ncbi:4588_t:CDS:2 [Dentiscutata erythropus]|uniref:4588_t:CDS:1 n=1 Tax=Dentiscutata erythropus TaxID=1348616 RepID=A0A9N9NNE5_9GLOM|nr:4588_t:CDS:2 [Dentiscutata erythropus]
MSIKNSSNSSTSPAKCKLNCLSNPSSQTEFNGSLIWWPPTSPLGTSLIVYIQCDGNSTRNIINAQGSNNTIAIVLNYNGKPCTPQSTSSDIIIPLFNEVSNDCHSNKSDTNMIFFGLDATIQINNPSNNGSTPVSSDNTVKGYQTAMVILYTVSGILLGLFFIVVFINVIRSRLRPPTDVQDQDDSNPKNGIAKAVLESFPVYFFTTRNKPDPKDTEKGKNVDSDSDSVIKIEMSEPNENTDNRRRLYPIDEDNDYIIPGVFIGHNNNSSVSFTEISSTITEEQLTCPICLGDFESGEELRILPCHHQYHTTCIDPWLLDISPMCPMCKADYTSWNINSISTINDIASRSSTSIGSVASTHAFPHFRWAKYLKAIRRAGERRRRGRQLQTRLSVGDVLASPQPQPVQNISRNNLPIDNSEESRIRRWTFAGG